MGKGSGGGHTPYEAPDNLRSSQLLSVIDALSEGPIEGPVDGLQSILVNQTPTVDADGNVNVHGVTVVYRVGEQEQSSLDGFEESGAETMLNAEVKNANPITRTITSKEIDRLRFTFGVSSLVAGTDDGDQVETSVNLSIQVQRAGAWVTEKDVTIQGKRTSQFLASVVVDNLPPRPFGIRMIRNTPDSTSARLQNKTLWSSYTEIIDLQQRYPNTAVVGVRVDAEQFGSQQVTMNYHVRGRIVRVPSNYDPITRVYTGIWDGSFKPAYTNNPAWCLLDLLTHPRYGMGDRMGMADVDIWSLYAIAQYCDQSVPDGFGGTEPRVVCNAYLATQRKVYDVLADFCSLMRCMPVWDGLTMTFVQDRPADKVWTYSNSNVVDGSFKYGFSALKDRHNAVEVRYIDPQNGWKASVELVEDQAAIVRYGRNLLKMEAFGCTSRGQARRMGLWVIQTELLETQTVDFMIGAEGLRHLPGDIIEICDNDYAGVTVGGRILDADTVSRTVTLDRDIALPPGGSAEMNLIGADGSPIIIPVVDLPAPNMVRLQTVPAGIQAYGVWGLRLSSMRRRLFRCMMLRENDDGTYAVTALQHVPEKEAIVDNGAHFEPLPDTDHGVIPPAIQHLSVNVRPDNNLYQAIAQWDTPRVVKGVKFIVRLTSGAGTKDNPTRLVASATVSETEFILHSLPLGDYQLTVRAMNSIGQQGAPTSVGFSIQAPEPPVNIDVMSGYFQLTLIPHQTYYNSDVQYEFWFSETRITNAGQIESNAKRLGIATYWVKDGLQKLGTDYYFYVRSVNQVGKSAFVEAVGQVNSDADGVLDILKDKITSDQITKDFLKGIDNNLVRDEFNKALNDSEAKVDQALTVLESAVGDSKAQLQALSQTVATEDAALSQKIDNVNAQVGENASAVQVISKAQADLKGDVSAMWSMQVQTTEDGKKVIAGIQATAEGGVGQVLILADRFAVMNPNNGSELLPFIIQNGQVIIDEAFMKSLNINDRFIVTPDGQLTIRSHKDSRVGLMMDSDLIQINDESGRPVIKLGDLRKTLV
ncbi:host specificity protein J [Edwardsiella piscicida]|uniref:phage tail protein n=1 Tax=Edwardsiella piscicida TaxID=1263550 RepID=UPI00084BC6C3|nr:host specificity protein J [Edwardsiella piscicida]AOP43703.1 host specificity protein J [Edwardsiella piscicida]EKS7766618.1 host specificity protein J [Edwardsiella piscicida]UCQ30299.1 host specificity protein J [Edwardsiella piscicida]UCQ56624.1 host specificity protein J [Edwardsiella piscicida]